MLAVALACILLTIVVMGVVIWSIRRHRDPRLKIQCDVGIDSLMPTLAGLTPVSYTHLTLPTKA